jgi:folate-binding protein YgfZ
MGIPTAPNELNSDYNPHEAGLTNYIDFEKGCYIGQEVIARLQTYDKVQKQLTGVRFSGQDITGEKLSIFNGDEEIGKITSMVNSVKFNELIGLAYVKKNFTNSKDQLTAKNGKGIAQNIFLNSLPFTK